MEEGEMAKEGEMATIVGLMANHAMASFTEGLPLWVFLSSFAACRIKTMLGIHIGETI